MGHNRNEILDISPYYYYDYMIFPPSFLISKFPERPMIFLSLPRLPGSTVAKCMATSAPDDVDVDRHALLEEEVKVGIFALCVFAKERNG